MPPIAFFDLDRTLISINSATAWMHRDRRAGKVSRRETVRAIAWFTAYRLGYAKMDEVVRSAVQTFEGRSVADFTADTNAFWSEVVVPTIRPGAVAAIERHRLAGDRLVLLTASSRQLGDAAARHFGLDAVLANEFIEENGRFTGDAREPLCFGDGKLFHAVESARQFDTSLEQCTFYTDSYTDRKVLDAVGTPVCVSPDPRLERVAKQRGWRIEEWGTAARRHSHPTFLRR